MFKKGKNKAMNVVLLVVVAGVWGLIILKLFSGGETPENLWAMQTAFPDMDMEELIVADTFQLQANYRDPFLGKRANTPKRVRSRSASSSSGSSRKKPDKPAPQKPIEAEEKPISWPEVHYAGWVSASSGQSDRVGLLNISGQDFLVSEGQLYAKVAVKKLWPDSVVLVFSEQERVFLK